ncbi:PAT family [Diplonema papillatum]|nr:PAT family [Diplonema papillatum]
MPKQRGSRKGDSMEESTKSDDGFVRIYAGESTAGSGRVRESSVMRSDSNTPETPPAVPSTCSDIREDAWSLALLFGLYVLQGLPMGLAAVVPMIIKDKGASLSDIGTFSLTILPYSVKLLWAPIIDSIFSRSFGRRKTWLVPCQLLIGCLMLAAPVGDMVDGLRVSSLTGYFFVLYFLCASQDIAVDGWALTLLSKKNVGHASTCNSSGQTLGFFISFTGFLTLESYGLITLTEYTRGCGLLFLICTFLIVIFVKEAEQGEVESLAGTYKAIWHMIKMPSVRRLALFLLVWKIPFAVGSVASLELQNSGVKKEHLAFVTTLSLPVNVLTPILIAQWTGSDRPFDIALRSYIPRTMLIVPVICLVALSAAHPGELSMGGYLVLGMLSVAETFLLTAQFAAQMAFFARIADPSIGGTYMTVLNTISNLGSLWPGTVALKMVEHIDTEYLSGFTLLSLVFGVFGVVWFSTIGRRLFLSLQALPREHWLLTAKSH